MGVTNVILDDLMNALKNISNAADSIKTTRNSLQMRLDQLGQNWNDKKYQELCCIVNECRKALYDILMLLLQGEKFILQLVKSIQEYESISINATNGGHTSESLQTSVSNEGIRNSATQEVSSVVINTGKEWTNCLCVEERNSIFDYSGTAYKNINAVLRGRESDFTGNNHEIACYIHNILQRSSIPCDCVVYRGASVEALGEFGNCPDEQLIGMIITDNGFMSTSINSNDAFSGDIRLEISVPMGANGAYIGYISQCGHYESEVLFDCGQRLVITDVRRDCFGNRTICATMLGRFGG